MAIPDGDFVRPLPRVGSIWITKAIWGDFCGRIEDVWLETIEDEGDVYLVTLHSLTKRGQRETMGLGDLWEMFIPYVARP